MECGIFSLPDWGLMGAERVDTARRPSTPGRIRGPIRRCGNENSLMGTFYAVWADENRLWKAEVEEGLFLGGFGLRCWES